MPWTGGGRGESGDAAGPYAIEREFEDVAAVVDGIGGRVHLFGHSYGGVCALEPALLTGGIDRAGALRAAHESRLDPRP